MGTSEEATAPQPGPPRARRELAASYIVSLRRPGLSLCSPANLRALRWNNCDVLDDLMGRLEGPLGHFHDPATTAVAMVFTVGVGVCLHAAYAMLVRATSVAARP